eukprot:202508-Chlamydomonas_euryale.AAC.4
MDKHIVQEEPQPTIIHPLGPTTHAHTPPCILYKQPQGMIIHPSQSTTHLPHTPVHFVKAASDNAYPPALPHPYATHSHTFCKTSPR